MSVVATRLKDFLRRWRPDEGPVPIITCLGEPLAIDASGGRVALLSTTSEPTPYDSGEGGGYYLADVTTIDVWHLGTGARLLASLPLGKADGVALTFSADGSHLLLTRKGAKPEEIALPTAPKSPG